MSDQDPGAPRPRTPRTRRGVGLVAAWLVAATLAVTVGVFAVTRLGSGLRDRGPIGENDLVRDAGTVVASPSPDPAEPLVRQTFSGDFGSFVVACQGKWAIGVEARPDREAGWQTVSYEPGPDDDIDAVFSNGRRSQEVEVYCNLGRPVLAELEDNPRPDESDD